MGDGERPSPNRRPRVGVRAEIRDHLVNGKNRVGTGYRVRTMHEPILLATLGKCRPEVLSTQREGRAGLGQRVWCSRGRRNETKRLKTTAVGRGTGRASPFLGVAHPSHRVSMCQ